MRVLKLSVLILLALVVVVVGIGSFLPKDFAVERSTEINASPEVVFDAVNSLRTWDAWSPWLARDPSIVNSYSGPEVGVGATVAWTSEKSGDGSRRSPSVNVRPESKPHSISVTWDSRMRIGRSSRAARACR